MSRMRSYWRVPSAKSWRGVVDDVVGAEGVHEVDLRGAADAGDLGAERLRQLDGVGADAAGRAEHQDRLARLHAPDVDERLQRRAAPTREPPRPGRRTGSRACGRAWPLAPRRTRRRIRARPRTPRRRPRTASPTNPLPPPCRRRRARRSGSSACAAPEAQAHHIGLAGHQVLGAAVEPGRAHVHEHLGRRRSRAGHPGKPQDLRAAVAVLDDRPHRGGRSLSCGLVGSSWCVRPGFEGART